MYVKQSICFTCEDVLLSLLIPTTHESRSRKIIWFIKKIALDTNIHFLTMFGISLLVDNTVHTNIYKYRYYLVLEFGVHSLDLRGEL